MKVSDLVFPFMASFLLHGWLISLLFLYSDTPTPSFVDTDKTITLAIMTHPDGREALYGSRNSNGEDRSSKDGTPKEAEGGTVREGYPSWDRPSVHTGGMDSAGATDEPPGKDVPSKPLPMGRVVRDHQRTTPDPEGPSLEHRKRPVSERKAGRADGINPAHGYTMVASRTGENSPVSLLSGKGDGKGIDGSSDGSSVAIPDHGTRKGDVTGRGGMEPPRIRYIPEPVYPLYSRIRGEEGSVVVVVEVLADGGAGDVEVVRSSGYHRLDRAVLRALRKATFIPARMDGRPVRSRKRLTFRFELDDR